jgi:hypothetical protein
LSARPHAPTAWAAERTAAAAAASTGLECERVRRVSKAGSEDRPKAGLELACEYGETAEGITADGSATADMLAAEALLPLAAIGLFNATSSIGSVVRGLPAGEAASLAAAASLRDLMSSSEESRIGAGINCSCVVESSAPAGEEGMLASARGSSGVMGSSTLVRCSMVGVTWGDMPAEGVVAAAIGEVLDGDVASKGTPSKLLDEGTPNPDAVSEGAADAARWLFL